MITHQMADPEVQLYPNASSKPQLVCVDPGFLDHEDQESYLPHCQRSAYDHGFVREAL